MTKTAANTVTRPKYRNRTRHFTLALLAATWLTSPHLAMAQVNPADAGTQVYNAQNGVPVVDIAKANGAGLSHNRYTDFNVDMRGLVLNNGNYEQMARQSQLAGQVMANLNLVDQAKVILNEVVSPNRSNLNGYTEVVGGAADVIIANPYGLACNGCGFINTPNVTLTTGKPQINGGGNLTGFRVDGGQILITGAGLDGTNQEYLALVSRSVKIDAQINAKTLDIVTGANDYDYQTKQATARTPNAEVPTYAVDSSALGGMYANRIRLIATEAGVGVKMLGEVATGVDDFVLDASGKIELGNKISAKRDIKITGRQAGSDSIKTTNAAISAENDVVLTAATGEIHLNGGLVTAGHDLLASSIGLVDIKSNDSMTDNNKRYAANHVVLTQGAGGINLDGSIYGAGNGFTANAENIIIGGAGATIYSDTTIDLTTATTMNLGTAALSSNGNMNLTSTNGGISISSGTAQAILSETGTINIFSGNGFLNAGKISAVLNNVIARVNGVFENTGTLQAKTTINIADKNNAATQEFKNSGTLLADTTLTVKSKDFTNTGNIQGTKGTTLTVEDLVNSGNLITSADALSNGSITAETVTNTGVIQSAKDMILTVLNTVTNSNKILAANDLTLVSGSNANLTLANNAGGIVQAANTLNLKGISTGHNFIVNNNATIIGKNLNFRIQDITNNGTVQSTNGTNSLFINNNLVNNANGKFILSTSATGTDTVQANAITNEGVIQSARSFILDVVTNLLNKSTGKVVNSAGDITILTSGYTNNEGSVVSNAGNVNVKTTGLLTNASGGILNAFGVLTISDKNNAATQNVTNTGTMLGNDTIVVLANTLTNNSGGTIQGTKGSTLTLTTLSNSGLIVASANSLYSGTINADSVTNTGTGIIQSAKNLVLNVLNTFTNSNKVLADNDLSILARTSGTGLAFVNNASGFIQAGNTLTLKGTGSNDNLNLNTQGGNLVGNALDFKVSVLNNAGTIQGKAGASTVLVTNTLTNNGKLILATASNGTGNVTASSITNSGTIQSAGTLALNVISNITNNVNSTIISTGNLVIRGLNDAYYSIANHATLQSLAKLDIKGFNGGKKVNIATSDGAGKYIGATSDINVDAITMANNSIISTTGAMTLNANTLSMSGTGSLVYGGTGTNNVTIVNGYTNNGSVFAEGVLNFISANINNTSTGMIGSNSTLNITSNGTFDNNGALYATNALNATTTGKLTNFSTGTIDSPGSISLTADDFLNNNNVIAVGNLTINARVFKNDVVGGDTRKWNWEGTSFDNVGNKPGDQDNRNYANEGQHFSDWVITRNDLVEEHGDDTRWMRATFSTYQYYTTAPPTKKPQLISSGTLTITNFQTATNIGGIISAPSVHINTTRSGATFDNRDLSLTKHFWQADWNHYSDCDFAGNFCDHYDYRSYDKFIKNSTIDKSFGAGIFGSLTASGFSLSNSGSFFSATGNTKSKTGATGTSLGNTVDDTAGTTSAAFNAITTANGTSLISTVNTISFGGISITLPTNPNGYFVISKTPGSKYLVETNPQLCCRGFPKFGLYGETLWR